MKKNLFYGKSIWEEKYPVNEKNGTKGKGPCGASPYVSQGE
jgi:hypothetical protein